MILITGEHDTINPVQSTLHTLHAVDPSRVAELADAMLREGWVGRPILVLDELALTGTHRLAAAIEAGIEVPIYRIGAGPFDPDIQDEQAWAAELAEALDDEERLAILKEVGDAESISLMQAEVDANG